jgi:lipopolysaccharide assembly outer membrane protein LptD (OstA)
MSQRIRSFLPLTLFVLALGASAPAPAIETNPAPDETYIIEGESLQGASATGTEIKFPRITHGVLKVTADLGRLSPDRDILSLHQNVHIADTTRVITSVDGTYRRQTRILDLEGRVHGVGPDGVLDAESLIWDRLSGWMSLRGNPRLQDPTRVLWADRIDYNSQSRSGTGVGHVRILLLPDSTWAYAERSTYDQRTGLSLLTGEPSLMTPAKGDEPRVDVTADTLLLDQEKRIGEAFGHVRIQRAGLKTESERARFLLRENNILLFGNPRAFDAEGEIRADTMSVQVSRREADFMKAFGHVEVNYGPREKAGEENLIVGDTLTARLNRGAVTDMEVQGSAMSLYLPAYHDAATGSGRNLCRARTIHVYLDRGEAKRVDLIQAASGVYEYPSEAERDSLALPAVIDSAKAGEPSPLLAAFLQIRGISLSDSQGRPYDRLFSERVDYQGDTIRFYVPEERIRILGQGVLKYRGSELKSHEIHYLAGEHLITATGEPELSDLENTVKGVKMTYRTDEREGIVYQGRTQFEQGRYFGREIKKMSGDELLVRGGDYSTCDVDSAPHYHFYGKRMKVILKDKVMARPVILYIRRIPIFALPYYIFPIRKGRHSGIMMPDLELGFARGRGRFVKNLGYYWAISDYMDLRNWIDYYDQGPQIYYNGIYNYRVRYLLDGNLDASYRKQKTAGGGNTVGYSLEGSHSQTLGPGAQLTAQVNFTSDKNFRSDRDFAASVNDRLNRNLISSLALRKSWSRAGLSVSARRTENLDEVSPTSNKVSLLAPTVSFTVNPGAIGRAADASGRGGRWTPLASTTYGTSFAFNNVYARTFNGRISLKRAIQQNLALNDNRSLGPYLRFQPSLNGNWAAFGRDNRGERYRAGYAWSASASAGSTVYGNFLFPVGPLTGLRHVIEPSVTYSYQPELRQLTYRDSSGTRRTLFPSVGGISLSGSKGSSMRMNLSQRFHAKWKRGEKVIKKENVLSWTTSTSYNFLAKRDPKLNRPRYLSPLSNSVSFRPFSTFNSSVSLSHDPYTKAPTSFNVSSSVGISSSLFTHQTADSSGRGGLNYGDLGESNLQGFDRGNQRLQTGLSQPRGTGPWTLSLNHSYSTQRGGKHPTNTFDAKVGLSPTRNWHLNGGIYLDLQNRKLTTQSFDLYRDLHCWDLRFGYSRRGAVVTYHFHIAIKQIPDVKWDREKV